MPGRSYSRPKAKHEKEKKKKKGEKSVANKARARRQRCGKKAKEKKTTAPGLRAWSPTALLSGPERALLRRSDGMRCSHDCMAVGDDNFCFQNIDLSHFTSFYSIPLVNEARLGLRCFSWNS